VVAFLAAMDMMAEQFPGAFSGYSLHVMSFCIDSFSAKKFFSSLELLQ
jgi:hypothetical protein